MIMDIKTKLFAFFMAIMAVVIMPSCGGNDDDEPSVYDPAGEIAGTYIGKLYVTNGSTSYNYDNASFIIRKETAGSVYYDIVREDGKKMLSNIPTTVGYSKDKTEYVLAAINEDGTVTRSGRLSYSGKCSVNGVEGYNFTFNGNKEK